MLKKILVFIFLLGFYVNSFAAATILVFGDSLSAAYGIDKQQGWVNLLYKYLIQNKFDTHVINASISGNTTQEGITQLPDALKRHRPTIVILELGANDGLRGVPFSTTRENLSRMIEMSQQYHAKVLLLGLRFPPNYGPLYAQQFSETYTLLAKKYNVLLVSNMLAGVDDKPEMIQSDNLHPTAAAQPIIFRNIWEALNKML